MAESLVFRSSYLRASLGSILTSYFSANFEKSPFWGSFSLLRNDFIGAVTVSYKSLSAFKTAVLADDLRLTRLNSLPPGGGRIC